MKMIQILLTGQAGGSPFALVGLETTVTCGTATSSTAGRRLTRVRHRSSGAS